MEGYGLKFSDDRKRHMYLYRERKTKRFAEWLFNGWVGSFMEWLLKKTFKQKTLKNKERLGGESCVIVSDDILKFHNHDKRKEYYEKWRVDSI